MFIEMRKNSKKGVFTFNWAWFRFSLYRIQQSVYFSFSFDIQMKLLLVFVNYIILDTTSTALTNIFPPNIWVFQLFIRTFLVGELFFWYFLVFLWYFRALFNPKNIYPLIPPQKMYCSIKYFACCRYARFQLNFVEFL